MFETICSLIPLDGDYPIRTRILDILKRVLNGTIYDVLTYQFHEERGPGGDYIPLRRRRPSIRYNLCRIVVEDSVSLLFGEGHFPAINSSDIILQAAILDVFKESQINQVMTQAAIRGSIGSVAILMRILKGHIFFEVLDTTYLTPLWDPTNPNCLLKVTERYKVSGAQLTGSGYDLPDPDCSYWFQREWDFDSETWFSPVAVGSPDQTLQVDMEKSVRHGLGFVPIVWIRNLPGSSSTGDASDGACTFRPAVETQIEIDYQLSQAGRGLKYSSDPTLLIKEPATTDNRIIKGAGNALVVSERGDAKLLEIGGTASSAVLDYVRVLRELALESVHGNRASADRLTAAQSGRALELMNQGLLWLADNLRVSYGESALLALARMIIRASHVYPLQAMDREILPLDPSARLSITWPQWYPPTADDRQKDAQTLIALATAGLISQATATKAMAAHFGVEDISSELGAANDDQKCEAL